MELKHIPLKDLHISALNMRHEKKAPFIDDILPSVRERGILQPLLVRKNAEGFEIIAGRRRYFSAKKVAEERGAFDDVPCAVMEQGDDAAALEASLIENAARLDPSPMKQFETFYRLIKEGRTPEQIAITFGLPKRQVEQRLALANLHPKLRELYGSEEVEDDTIEYLTMATKAQQKEWLRLKDEGEAPHGSDVKHWLMGGAAVETKVALFPVETYKGEIKTDLFGEQQFFADAATFWELQRAAIEWRKQAYLENGWEEVIVLTDGERFQQWEHERLPKTKGGKVFVTVSGNGQVEFFEGWISRAHLEKAKKQEERAKAGKPDPADRPAMTNVMENYLELHRHAAVRLALIEAPATALPLLIAHAIASSGNWSVRQEGQRSASNDVKASIEKSEAQKLFEAEREKVGTLLDLTVNESANTAKVFVRLMALKEAQVQRIAAFIMADTLAVGSESIETAGLALGVDGGKHWTPDETFFSLIREKATLSAMIAEVAGKDVAKGNANAKTAIMKQVLIDSLGGKNGRKKAERWLPGWMAFPFVPYGKGRSGLAETAKEAGKLIKKL
ncbi:MAG: ParB/RepB/Spo0J family partition protein [Alphaproteobacteria bacterium]|nr:ParB/RepB/Spo0J family partition protein [Reyranella sp.]MBL6940078.1 ParB/RepB/Spo0J family partition protein [Alphaproteobacteria bacterium]MBL7100165.1 ParB/RepB/Spo0J family partition protein [Alphaproteobacteria bacterium]